MAFKQKGFTLMELMIVVAIVGILTSIAYPSYQSHILKTKRSDAKAGLMQMSDLQERYYLQINAYAATEAILMGAAGPHMSPEGYYTLTVTAGDTNVFGITATAGAAQAADTGCTVMTINQAGTKTPAACW